MAENVREIVLDTLLSLEREEAFSHTLLKAVLDKYDYLDGRDKALMKRLTEGVVERRIELDYYLDAFSSVPVCKMKPLIRCLMRMSAYQILYMDSIPDSAAVNEACKLANKRKFQNLRGFVNAVLRKIATNKESLPLPDETKEPILYLAVKYSMPEWIIRHFNKLYGMEKTKAVLQGMLAIHPVSLRFRTDMDEQARKGLVQRIEETGAVLSQSKEVPYIYLAEHVTGVENLPGYKEGLFNVQDASSAMAVEAADVRKGDFVMDICAAPGGKTMLAAETAGKVLSRDVSDKKLDRILENVERMHLENVEAEVWDATVPDESLTEAADVVFMDVPCSGLGVMGKKRDIKYHVTPESLKEIVDLQRTIVENSWRYVKPGGTLLYSTCTINPEENEEMVKWICANFPFTEEKKGVQLLPGIQNTDGFFFAKLKRNMEERNPE